jgi:hypothetical protein
MLAGGGLRDGERGKRKTERQKERERERAGEGVGGKRDVEGEGETWRSSSPRPPVLASRLTWSVLSPAHVRQDGVTGLFMAAQRGHAEVVRLLVEGKADVNAARKVHTPLREALRVKRRDGGAQIAERYMGDGREIGGGGGVGGVRGG